MGVYSLFYDNCGEWTTWKCKDSVTKPWEFIVCFMIILVDEQLESVRIQ